MKVLVTGGAGFIGSHTTDILLKDGYQVRILDNLVPPVHQIKKKPEYISTDVEFIVGDVRKKSDMERALKGIDAVFHFAAYQDYLTDFSKFAFVNDGGTALLYEIIVNKHLPIQKVILGSSQAVYGEGKYKCYSHGNQYPPPRQLAQLEKGDWDVKCPVCYKKMELVCTNESVVNPHNQYAISKYSQELYAWNIGKRYGIPTVIMRYSITQGPRQSFHNAYSGILRIFTIRLLQNLNPIIYEDGKQLRDYVHVRDIARANIQVLENDTIDFEIFNVGGNNPTSVIEYANLIVSLLRKDVEIKISNEFRFGDSRHIFSDISKIRKLGWQPKHSLEQIVEDYIEWAQEQREVSDYSTKAKKLMRKRGVIRSVNR